MLNKKNKWLVCKLNNNFYLIMSTFYQKNLRTCLLPKISPKIFMYKFNPCFKLVFPREHLYENSDDSYKAF